MLIMYSRGSKVGYPRRRSHWTFWAWSQDTDLVQRASRTTILDLVETILGLVSCLTTQLRRVLS
jgi:hypothetical protein